MYDAFALVDGGGAGVDANDDRKLEESEWAAGRDKLKGYGFVALANKKGDSVKVQFKQMNSGIDGAQDSVVMLNEFCAWIEKNEVNPGGEPTEIGACLIVGDEPF